MDHRVFVSSTLQDLIEYRTAVRDTIQQLGARDIAMEGFGADDIRPKEKCVRLITEETDSFVGIYAYRYGFVPKGGVKSITEVEFDAATRAKVKRFVYIVDEETPWKPRHIERGPSEARLEQFKRKLRQDLTPKSFSSPHELARYVAADIGKYQATISLKRVDPADPGKGGGNEGTGTTAHWREQRGLIYRANRGIFLVHSITPSNVPGQLFDVSIFLKAHKVPSLAEVAHAEFFLGPSWGNRVIKVPNDGDLIGISTSAWGEFLTICNVVLKDGSSFLLHRYVDFGIGTGRRPLEEAGSSAREDSLAFDVTESSRPRPKLQSRAPSRGRRKRP